MNTEGAAMKTVEKELCPDCDELTTPDIIEKEVKVTVRKEEYCVIVKRAVCWACNSEFGLSGIDFDEAALAYNEYRRKHNYLFPEDVKNIREKYALNQKSFSRLINSGENTIHLYEKGGLQDGAHNAIIKQAENPEVMKKLYDDNNDAVTMDIRQAFEEKLKALLEEKNKNKMREIIQSAFDFKQDIYCGYKKFDIEYFINFMLTILGFYKPLSTTHMGKIPCYLDFLKFKNEGVSFTGCRYVVGKYGPFLNDYSKLFCFLKDSGVVDSDIDISGSGEIYVPLRQPDMSVFSKKDADLIKEVALKLGPMSTQALKNKTHNEFPGWDENKIGQLISFENARNVRL